MIVHQVLAGAGPHDAVTSQVRAFRARFRSWGWGGQDYASFIAPGLGGAILPRDHLAPAPDDLVIVHQSAVVPRLRDLLRLPNRKLLVYHNITPPEWLWEAAPALAAHCAAGREQLPDLVKAVDACVAVSHFNAQELVEAGAHSPEVIPLLLDLERLAPPDRPAAPARPPQILFVGRLSPHKRQDLVIRAFSLYRALHAPEATLYLVGQAVTRGYRQHLQALAESVAPGAIRFAEGLPDAELGRRYREAAAFLCLSEHEGFCLPLIESMRFGLPVVARRAGAVPETVGDAAPLLEFDDDLLIVAELLHLVVSDDSLRAELRRRGADRLSAYAPAGVSERLRAVLETAVASEPAR